MKRYSNQPSFPFLDFFPFRYQNLSLIDLLLNHRGQIRTVVSRDHTVALQISDQLILRIGLAVIRRCKIKPRCHSVLLHPKSRASGQIRTAGIPAEIHRLLPGRPGILPFIAPYHGILKFVHLFPGKFYLTHAFTLTFSCLCKLAAVRAWTCMTFSVNTSMPETEICYAVYYTITLHQIHSLFQSYFFNCNSGVTIHGALPPVAD